MVEELISREALEKRVAELAEAIDRDYQGKDLLVIGILKGAFMFMADLVRRISMPLAIDFMAVASYGSSTKTSGVVRIIKDLDKSVSGRHVLLVEDIVDSGLTLRYLIDSLGARGAASIKTCILLDKPDRRKVEVPVDYLGFEIPDVFVVGYGMDHDEHHRHLPYLARLE